MEVTHPILVDYQTSNSLILQGNPEKFPQKLPTQVNNLFSISLESYKIENLRRYSGLVVQLPRQQVKQHSMLGLSKGTIKRSKKGLISIRQIFSLKIIVRWQDTLNKPFYRRENLIRTTKPCMIPKWYLCHNIIHKNTFKLIKKLEVFLIQLGLQEGVLRTISWEILPR